jgi:tetratricopeptide (TPR) repeat protein
MSEPIHRGILAVDIEHFGDLGHTDPLRVLLRETMRGLLDRALTVAELDAERTTPPQDLGDGALVLTASAVPTIRLLYPLLPQLARGLASANAGGALPTRLRLRVVVHEGNVLADRYGFTSEALVHAFRLLDAEIVRMALRAAPAADLVVVASEAVWQSIIRHGYQGIEPAGYQPVWAQVKETRTRAWIHLPGLPVQPTLPSVLVESTTELQLGPAIFRVPPANPNFTGRAKLLRTMHRTLNARRQPREVRAVALHGLGGVGKSQAALEYAHRFGAHYRLVWWVPAGQAATIRASLAALARLLGLPAQPGQQGQAEDLAVLFDELAKLEGWLLIYDDADGPEQLRPFQPPIGDGQLLITSRNPAWGAMATPLGVEVFTPTEAVAFLRVRTGSRDRAAAGLIADSLRYLPLALEQAAAYVEEAQLGLPEYLERLRGEHRAAVLSRGQPSDYHATVATTWLVSLRRLHAQAPAAEQLLLLRAFLAPEELPRAVLRTHAAALPAPLDRIFADSIASDRAVAAAGRYSLIAATPDGLGMHPLLQEVVRTLCSPSEQEHWTEAAVRLLDASFPHDVRVPAHWSRCSSLVPHALVATELAESLDVAHDMTARILERVALFEHEQGEDRQALVLHRRALALDERRLGPDHPQIATGLSHLGGYLRELGAYDEARDAFTRALAIRQATLAPDDLAIAESLSQLGMILWDLGRAAEARPLLEQALDLRTDLLGPDHPDLTHTLSVLGLVLWDLHDLRSARALLQRALAIREAANGSDDPRVASTLVNLAKVLHDLGEFEAALAAHERALDIRERRLGPDHWHLANGLNNLGPVLLDLGRQDEALAAHHRALAIFQTKLGPDHAHVARSLEGIGRVLHRQGRLEEARAALEQALAIFQAQLHPDHPEFGACLATLAALLRDLGELDAARLACARSIEILHARLGPDHPAVTSGQAMLRALGQPTASAPTDGPT